MGWSIGGPDQWGRFVGYGVPAWCDHPGCNAEIDRGLGHVCCKQEPFGGDNGCGLFFCGEHANWMGQCERCAMLPMEDEDVGDDEIDHARNEAILNWPGPFDLKPEHPDWLRHQLRDASWATWRKENPDAVKRIRVALRALSSSARLAEGV